MSGLDHILYALLHQRAARRALAEGRLADLGASPEDAADLAVIDQEQLELAARRIRQEVFTRSRRGTGSLRSAFAGTIAAWRQAHSEDPDLDELGARFVESDEYLACRELPYAGEGPSLEESFFRFAERAAIGTPELRRRELYSALFRTLLLTPDPGFTLPRELRRTARGYAAVLASNPPTLFATVDHKLVTGPVTPLVAGLVSGRLTPGNDPVALATRHELSRMGLI